MRMLGPADFHAARAPQPLADNDIHLWFFPHWDGAARGAAESAFMRALLAGYLGRDPAQLVFERAAHGKPLLHDGALEFNLSHSGGALLVALNRTRALGVDLELPRRPRPVLDLARRYFTAHESAALAQAPQTEQQARFLRLWACKEAVLKAHGGGVSFGLERAEFDLDAAGSVLGLRAFAGSGPAPWCVVGLEVEPNAGACGALAWQGGELPIRAYRQESSTNG